MHENKILSVQNIKLANIDSNNAFNFIRLVCCLIVIYEHTVVLTDIPFINLNLRGIAVSIFFYIKRFLGYKKLYKLCICKEFLYKKM